MAIQQTIKVQAVDNIQFLKTVQEVITRGARYDETTYVYLNTMPLMAQFIVELDEDNAEQVWKDNGPWIFAVPLAKKEFKYSKEQLEEMDWDELKKVVKDTYGITGRDRNVLINQYLKQAEEKASE